MVRIGIIGSGSMAAYHAKKFSRIPDVTVAAICDRDPEKAGKISSAFNSCRVYGRIRDMLEKEQLDGISIATIDSHHAEAARKGMEAGLCVFCEKPLASSFEEAEDVASTVCRNDGRLMLNFSKRNIPAVSGAVDLIKNGAIGNLTHIRLSYLQSWYLSNLWGIWREEPRWLWRLCSRYGTGGVIGDLGAHLFDLLILFAGTPETIDGSAIRAGRETIEVERDTYDIDSPVFFEGLFFTDRGIPGSLEVSICTPGTVNSLSVSLSGTLGRIELDLEREKDSLHFYRMHAHEAEIISCPPVESTYERFIRMIRSGEQDELDVKQGLKVQELIEAAGKSCSRKPVLSLNKIKFPEVP